MAYYLDLYNGNPQGNGTSILETITGSATRSNVTALMADLTYPYERLANTDVVTVTDASLAVCNVSYAALYSAASGGTLTHVARVGAHFTINKGNPVRFLAPQLAFGDSIVPPAEFGQWDFSNPEQSGQVLTCGIC